MYSSCVLVSLCIIWGVRECIVCTPELEMLASRLLKNFGCTAARKTLPAALPRSVLENLRVVFLAAPFCLPFAGRKFPLKWIFEFALYRSHTCKRVPSRCMAGCRKKRKASGLKSPFAPLFCPAWLLHYLLCTDTSWLATS